MNGHTNKKENNKTSPMFNKQPNRTGKYIGDKVCLDEEQFRVQLET